MLSWRPRPSRIAEVPGDEDLTTLVETRKVLDKSMRLYPPVPLLSRQAIGPDRLGDVEIKPRTRVIIAPWVLHRNRRLWRDPELFMPDRFAPENRAAIPRFAYLPFGAGTRVCVGMTFANHEMLLTVAMIMRRFRLTLAEGADIQPFARMTLRPMNGLPMRISAR